MRTSLVSYETAGFQGSIHPETSFLEVSVLWSISIINFGNLTRNSAKFSKHQVTAKTFFFELCISLVSHRKRSLFITYWFLFIRSLPQKIPRLRRMKMNLQKLSLNYQHYNGLELVRSITSFSEFEMKVFVDHPKSKAFFS